MGVFLSLSDTRARNPSKSQVMWAFTLLPGELIPTYYRSSRCRTPTTPWRRRKRLIPCLYIMDPCHNQKGNNGEFDLLNFLSVASKEWGRDTLMFLVMQISLTNYFCCVNLLLIYFCDVVKGLRGLSKTHFEKWGYVLLIIVVGWKKAVVTFVVHNT